MDESWLDRPPRAPEPTRRSLLRLLALLLPAPLVLAVCGRREPSATAQDRPAAKTMPPTPACGDEDDVTPRQTEGPFYTPDSPERTSLLEPGIEGTRVVVSGRVLTTDCRPVAGALVDFWHADDAGRYDNAGYKLRGHQFTDARGAGR